ncbi:unnamed protein product [Citrullus colocynthis]|uniref:Uncharacterized protein n=1 Tax=Citrullus colocynthis TaxID=252529 RepID=A0ABP0Z9L7_9ROSI
MTSLHVSTSTAYLDVVKVNLVYIYELRLSGKDKTKSNIDKSLLDDVEDLNFFNCWDWGEIIWERTFSGLQKTLKDKVFAYKEKARANQNYVVKYNLRASLTPSRRITTILVLLDVEQYYRDTPVAERAVYVDQPEDDRVYNLSLTNSDSIDNDGVKMILNMSMSNMTRSVLSL